MRRLVVNKTKIGEEVAGGVGSLGKASFPPSSVSAFFCFFCDAKPNMH